MVQRSFGLHLEVFGVGHRHPFDNPKFPVEVLTRSDVTLGSPPHGTVEWSEMVTKRFLFYMGPGSSHSHIWP